MAKSPRLSGAKAQARIRGKQLSRLKTLGLVSKGQGRTAKSRYGLIRKYRDVLNKRASVVTLPKSEARKLSKSFKVKGRKVVVPRVKGEKIRVDAEGRITATRKVGGERVKRIVHAGGKMPKPRKGKKFLYTIPFSNGGRVRFDSMQALQEFMKPYAEKSYSNWRQYLEIEEVDADDDGEAEEE